VIRERDRLLVQTPESLRASLRLDVRPLSEVTAIDRAAKQVTVREVRTGRVYVEAYDRLVLAPGAKSLRPPMPGLKPSRHLRVAQHCGHGRHHRASRRRRETGRGDGGYIGIEAAENLRKRGLEVSVVEKMPQLMGPLDPEMARLMQEELERHGVRVMTGCGVTGFEDRNGQVVVKLETVNRWWRTS